MELGAEKQNAEDLAGNVFCGAEATDQHSSRRDNSASTLQHTATHENLGSTLPHIPPTTLCAETPNSFDLSDNLLWGESRKGINTFKETATTHQFHGLARAYDGKGWGEEARGGEGGGGRGGRRIEFEEGG